VKQTSDQKLPQRLKLSPNDVNYKTKLLQQVINTTPFKVGDRVKIRRLGLKGNITHIEHDADKVEWVSNKPFNIVVTFDNGDIKQCYRSHLKRSK
jgi:hypothetical protein